MPVPHDSAAPVSECVAFACNFADAREATRRLRAFLERQGMVEPDLFAAELALTEACNNAVQHVGPRGRELPASATAIVMPGRVELQVRDHTEGFDWPTGSLAAPSRDAEHGRGLFLIRSVMDGATYRRGNGENTLTMWKVRQME